MSNEKQLVQLYNLRDNESFFKLLIENMLNM